MFSDFDIFLKNGTYRCLLPRTCSVLAAGYNNNLLVNVLEIISLCDFNNITFNYLENDIIQVVTYFRTCALMEA